MKTARLGLLVIFASITVVANAIPTILIYQSKVPTTGKSKDNPNVDVASFIAKEFDSSGRLIPIVYSMSDPAFKAAMTSGRLRNVLDNPRSGDVFEVSRQLRADYLLVIEAVHSGKSVKSKLKVLRGERQIWRDENDLSVTVKDTMDMSTTAQSIAHTFVVRMDAGPFKAYPDQPKIQNPTLQPGQSPSPASTEVKITPETSDTELQKNIESLVAANKTTDAILILRDAVDTSPFDIKRRTALIELLQVSMPQAAAQEARRAAILMPDRVELRVLSARAWMQAGKPDEAQKDLNEAVARDPNGAATRILLAELSLGQLDATKALGHLDAAIKQQDTAHARFLRAICRALLGGVDGMQIDLAQIDKLEKSRSQDTIGKRYAQASDILDRAFNQDGVNLRSLIPKLVVKPKDQGIREELEQMLRLAHARTAFLSALSVPAGQKLPQDQRLLAHKLLIQSLLDVQSYQSNSDEDTLAEARINLGEALKHIQAAQERPQSAE